MIRWIRYLFRFGLFIYRDNAYQTSDVDFVFSYLWHVLDIYTGRKYINSMNELDELVSKDTAQEDTSHLNPFLRFGSDIKYRLFNKSFGVQIEQIEETNNYKDKCNSNEFHSKVLKEIIFIFHFLIDMRQHYLMTNNVEYF